MKTILTLLLFLFTSCYSQNSTTLTFVNKSSFDIDSILIQKPEKVIFGKLTAGQQYSKTLNNVELNTYNEGVFHFQFIKGGK